MLQNQIAIELQPQSRLNAKSMPKSPATSVPRSTPVPTSNNGDGATLRPQDGFPSTSNNLTKGRSNIVIAILSLVLFMNSIVSGFITVGIPRMASDLHLEPSLLLWPQSVYGLTSGSSLLLAGAVADVIGSRLVNLTGTFFLGVFIIACGLPTTGIQLIMFRAMQGIAIALIQPTGMGILSITIPDGTKRNIAFSCLGIGQVLGYALGLVLSGVLIATIGWRAGFYITGAVTLVIFVIGVWALPADQLTEKPTLKRLGTGVDWIGAGIASACMAMFSYVLAMITSDIVLMREPANIVLLSASLALVPAFIFWVDRQERLSRPALIPNSIWKNTAFTAVCLIVLLSFAVMQTMELFVSLFFQNVQQLSVLQSSIRFLPSVVVGFALELTTGFFVHRLSILHLILISSFLSAGAPLLMALINPNWPYWYDAFFAQILSYFSVDVLFTVGILIVSDVFPTRTQSLAGAVFNTLAQFGTSIGLCVMGVISNTITRQSRYTDKKSPAALEEGYRATFWTSFAFMLVACGVAAFGLRRVGRVGAKRD